MLKKIFRSPVTTVALFVLAAGLLLTGTIGGVLAAPLIAANRYYTAGLEVDTAPQLAIQENGKTVDGNLLADLTGDDTFLIGKSYDEGIAVVNTGGIDVYVRISIYRYWTDGDDKVVDLDPSYIGLEFEEDGWTIDEDASTPERTVLYYASPIAPGEATELCISAITIDPKVASAKGEDGEFLYDGMTFNIMAVADGVQAHNSEEAMLSAWGRTN